MLTICNRVFGGQKGYLYAVFFIRVLNLCLIKIGRMFHFCEKAQHGWALVGGLMSVCVSGLTLGFFFCLKCGDGPSA